MAPRIPRYRRTRLIAPGDCDELGHVNNVAWVRFVVELAVAHSTALGLDFETTRSHGGVWVVRHHDIRYQRSALPGDEIVEETWVSALRGARSIRHALFSNGAGEHLVAATTEWAFADPSSERARRIPAAVAERFDVITDSGGDPRRR